MASNSYPHPILAREGWPFILLALVLAVGAHASVGWAWAWPLDVVLVFVVQFFRDPARTIPDLPNAVLSPADGRIVKIEKTFDPFAQRDAILVSVFMNVFNVHSNRSGVNGVVRSVNYFPGLFVNADLDKASTDRTAHSLLCASRACAAKRRALRLHSFWLACGCVFASERASIGRTGGQGIGHPDPIGHLGLMGS